MAKLSPKSRLLQDAAHRTVATRCLHHPDLRSREVYRRGAKLSPRPSSTAGFDFRADAPSRPASSSVPWGTRAGPATHRRADLCSCPDRPTRLLRCAVYSGSYGKTKRLEGRDMFPSAVIVPNPRRKGGPTWGIMPSQNEILLHSGGSMGNLA
jgi:hypothetical protein